MKIYSIQQQVGISFQSNKRQISDNIVNSAFKKIAPTRNGKLGAYYGTTKHGENISIEELSLAKKAALYIQKFVNNKSIFETYELTKSLGENPKVLGQNGKEIHSVKKLEMINSYLETLV